MKISELIERLKELETKHGDLEVMFKDLDDGDVWGITRARYEMSDGNYPESWDMPEGFEFIRLNA